MTTTLHWHQIALRLLFTVIGGAVIGFDRGEHGRPAGLRTTLLVCLAASVAMIQANLLMSSTGKGSDSFVVLDLMRLPLGILSGMGFIGAGAILKKGNLVIGVTTAATLWFVTVMGLCFGGGQIGLGIVALVLGSVVLSGLRWLDRRMPQDRHAILVLKLIGVPIDEAQLRAHISKAGFKVRSLALSCEMSENKQELQIGVHWRATESEPMFPAELAEVARYPGVFGFEWKPQ